MQDQSELRSARARIFLIIALIALLVPASAASAQRTAGPDAAAGLSPRLLADASWHGRPIQQPWPVQRVAVDAPDAAGLRRGTGFVTAGGSERVRGLQRRLVRLGYRPGRIDGLFGPRTQAAVIAFQRKHALTQTGVAGGVTLRTLRSRTSARPAARAEPSARHGRAEPSRLDAALADAPPAPDEEPVRAAAPREPESPAVGGDGGLDTTPLLLALGFSLAVAVLTLVALLSPRRQERRVFAYAPSRTGGRAMREADGRVGVSSDEDDSRAVSRTAERTRASVVALDVEDGSAHDGRYEHTDRGGGRSWRRAGRGS